MNKPAKIFLFHVFFTELFGAGKSYGKRGLFAYQQIAAKNCCYEKSKLQTSLSGNHYSLFEDMP